MEEIDGGDGLAGAARGKEMGQERPAVRGSGRGYAWSVCTVCIRGDFGFSPCNLRPFPGIFLVYSLINEIIHFLLLFLLLFLLHTSTTLSFSF